MKKSFSVLIFITIFAILLPQATFAVQKCQVTSALYEIKPLPEFYDSNNLRHFIGSLGDAIGTPLVLKGYLYDEKCVPIPNGIVEIWHKNYSGFFNYERLRNGYYDPNFTGSGTANTNNLGEFVFYTVFPGTSSANETPFVNIRVRHPDFPILETRFYFEDHPHSHDPLLRRLSMHKRHLLMLKRLPMKNEALEYEMFIVLDGRSKYKVR